MATNAAKGAARSVGSARGATKVWKVSRCPNFMIYTVVDQSIRNIQSNPTVSGTEFEELSPLTRTDRLAYR